MQDVTMKQQQTKHLNKALTLLQTRYYVEQ